jgi:hypothetical protein
MAIYAVVENGTVTNMVEWDGSSKHPDSVSWVLADDNAYIGGIYDGSSFSSRPVGLPDTYDISRKSEYPSIEELIVALWEGVIEERMEAAVELENKRQAIKIKYPKSD